MNTAKKSTHSCRARIKWRQRGEFKGDLTAACSAVAAKFTECAACHPDRRTTAPTVAPTASPTASPTAAPNCGADPRADPRADRLSDRGADLRADVAEYG